ncbi:GNAT family N-acetyltransferase [Neobacillus niacini]|uniref:GNAT family N-acetyltransferase n=1 Tax=Neobacillus niacini TaxID=86668 RepID=UPI00285D97DA|nr:GNAT family N-acetyltransferase [Neobacillus niacini]MDR7003078.1 putative GNAT family acetyltransferase [Neobacillus niacini]
MIKLVKYDDLSLFKNDVVSYLERFEAENNLIFGVLLSLGENDKSPLLMAKVIKDNDIGLVLLQTHPSQIILSKAVSFTSREIQVIGEKLSNTIQEIPGFIGEKSLTTDLAKYISNLRGIHASVVVNQKIYKLEKVKKKIKSNGKLRTAKEIDLHIIKDWVYQFCYEINQPLSLKEADKKAKELIKKGNLVVWEINGGLVSMAYATRPTQSNITISYVYTPISERKKGYASDCVSAFTQSLLDRGYKTTSLYTDLNNPTSNKIYMQIGYEAIMDSIAILLK